MNLRERRVVTEAELLKQAYPGLMIDQDFGWVLIPEFELPFGWRPPLTAVLIEIPANYPEAGPFGFFLGDRLKRWTGGSWQTPGHIFGEVPYRGKRNHFLDLGYRWYCLHAEPGAWTPRHDSLISFVQAIWTYMGTPD